MRGISAAVRVPRDGRGAWCRLAGAQRRAVVAALVGQHGPPVATKLLVLVLQLPPRLPLAAQLADILGMALVGAAPGLRHLLHSRPGAGLPAQRDPGGDLRAELPADRAVLLLPGGDRDQLLEDMPLGAVVVVQRHPGYQFSMDRVKIRAMSSSSTGRGQVASSRCCFIVPGTRLGTSDSV